MSLLLAAIIVTVFFQWGRLSLPGEHNASAGGVSPINTDCVDGGKKKKKIERFSFLQPMVAGKKIASSIACLGLSDYFMQ